jgi:hypothetical protein
VQLGSVGTKISRLQSLAGRRQPLDRRILVRFPADQFSELAVAAEASGISRGALVRHLVELGRQGLARQQTRDVELVALAALLATEQGLELLQQIVPEGRQRAVIAREVAVAAAETRLEQLRDQLAEEGAE